ncbi:type I restriction endonuclease subunit R, EcoR124 family [Fructobacillus fructosus]|uniref:type I restriction endonuclease subunit R, EcoR124 family n=1 Tax=Fructobacillus fructosus TaxID=1631 RepID=UPI003BABA166
MNKALEVYSNSDSANIDIKKIDPTDGGVLAKPFEQVVSEASEVVEKLREFSSDFMDIPNSEKNQNEMMTELRRYNRLVNQLKQSSDYSYDHPEDLLTLIGLTVEQENTLTGSLTTQIKKAVAITQGVDISDLDLEMTHISDVKVNYDYLRDLLADLANQMHDQDHEKADQTVKDIREETKQLDDQKYAKQVERTANGLRSGELTAGDYPVKSEDVEGLLTASENISKRGAIQRFIYQWGLDVRTTEIEKVLVNHQKGQDDLNTMGQLDQLRQNGQANYKELANDPEVKQLKKIKYRNAFSDAFIKFADAFVEEY